MAKPKIETVAAASLIQDFAVYPRHKINSTNTARIIEAMRAGAIMPPVIADRATRRIADGFHRVDAALKLNGDDATIAVELRDYANDAELFLDAARLNAGHGQMLAPFDRARCLERARELGIEPVAIAAALGITRERLADLEVRKMATTNGEITPIKRTVQHLHGQELTEKQYRGMMRAAGMPVAFYVDQVINAIENDLLDPGDVRLSERLAYLADLLIKSKAA